MKSRTVTGSQKRILLLPKKKDIDGKTTKRMKFFSIRVFVMALQALLGLVSRTRGFTGSFSTHLKPSFSSSIRSFGGFNHHIRYASTQSSDQDQNNPKDDLKSAKKKAKSASDKSKLLAAAFDELAIKEGFDSSMSRMTEDATFEDDFIDEDDFDDDDDFIDDDEDDTVDDNMFDESNFDLSDFVEGGGKEENTDKVPDSILSETQTDSRDSDFQDDNEDLDDDDDDFLDFGGDSDDGDDMDARIAQAQRDMVKGHVSVPEGLDDFALGSSKEHLAKLGFKEEENFYGNDETRRKNTVTLITNAMTCSACGSDFQARNKQKPGYLPDEKFDVQVKLSKVEEMQKLKEKAESSEWTSDDEIEYLIQTSGKGDLDGNNEANNLDNIDIDAYVEELGLDLNELEKRKKVICARCHSLQNSGKVDDSLRPGWTDEPTLSQEQFQKLLR